MRCLACYLENPAGKKFCGDCGVPLGSRCLRCGGDNPANKKFCGDCGAPVELTTGPEAVATGTLNASPPRSVTASTRTPASETRKVITVIFADLMGSTALHERLDPESVNRVMDAYYRAVRGPVEAAGGTVVQLLGDGVLCAFGIPLIAEDDALRAVRAAVGIQQAFRAFLRTQQWLSLPIGLRVAVNTGEVVVSEAHPAGLGDPLNVAARLQQEAQDGEVLIGQATRRLVADAVTLEQAGVFALRGRAEAVTAYRVVSLDRPAGAAVTSFVGRDEELRRVLAVYDTAVAENRTRLAVVLGSPGLGKSRLLDELGRRLAAGATVMKASCDAAGGATFAPIAQAVRTLLGVPEGAADHTLRPAVENVLAGAAAASSADGWPAPERARIVDGITALVAGTPGSPEETFFVVRRFLTALAAAKPVLLTIDDLHWAEPLLLDLVEHLVHWGRGLRLMVLVGARPELRTTRSALATHGTLVAEVITMTGLDAAAATQLAANVIGAGALPAAVTGRVLATSEGNPLFLCALARMLVSDGILTFGGGQWTTAVDLATLDMPPTIHALLAARIERLRPQERAVLERAAVIGRQFSRTAVAHLLGEPADLDTHLEALRRGEFIEPDTGWCLGEPALRFHHVLIRDVAYRRVLKETRAELHERFANWLVDRIGDAGEHDEAIGFHLEHAHRNRLELGPLDARGRVLGERAAERLGAAGRRALARDDVSLAAGLLGRALARLDLQDPARADLALDWCEALLAAGEVSAAAEAIAELARFASTSARLRAWHVCFAGQLAVLTDSQSLRTTAAAVADAAENLAALDDTAGEAKAHTIHALALSRLGQIGPCEAALDRALTAARRARDRRRAIAVLAGAPVAALWGPSPVTRASGRCLDVVRVLRITQGAPAVEAVALRCQGVLEMLRGRTEAARRLIASSRRLVEELGSAQQILEADVFGALIDLLDGNADAAETALRSAYAGLRERGLAVDAARAAALLGRALLAQGLAAEAEALSCESEGLAGDDLKAAIAWRGVRAEALARRGETREAVALARAGVDIAAGTDALLDHADARTALAAALRADGQHAEADAEEQRALELWEAKGAIVLVERARRTTEPSETARAGDRRPARVDAPSGSVVPSASRAAVRRPVAPNFATAQAQRLDAAVAASDRNAIRACFADDLVLDQRFYAVDQGHEEAVTSADEFLADRVRTFRHEPLATLGNALALCRLRIAGEGAPGAEIPYGAYEIDWLVLIEATAEGCATRVEMFEADQLIEAVTRLYERHAERAPTGPGREVASTTARCVAAILRGDLEALPALSTEDCEQRDHRRLGLFGGRGRDLMTRSIQSFRETTRDLSVEVKDVLGLAPRALLVRKVITGTDRAGGRFELESIQLRCFSAEGFQRLNEIFDVDRAAEAVARFEEVCRDHTPTLRVTANAATAAAERVESLVATRDTAALQEVFGNVTEFVEHSTGGTFDAQALLATWNVLLRSEAPQLRQEILATLGDALALCHSSMGFVALPDGDLASFGPVQRDEILLLETGVAGRLCRIESFAAERLGDALVRLYARWAERAAPEERARAAVVARAVAATTPPNPDAIAALLAPDLAFEDRRRLGLGGARGAERYLRGLGSLFDATRDLVNDDQILMASPQALLVRRRGRGTLRATGGAFEHHMQILWVYGPDGRITHIEMFDPECESEALARLDALTGVPADGPPHANAAWRATLAANRAWRERRWDDVVASHHPDFRLTDHRRVTGVDLRGDDFLRSTRLIFDMPESEWRATLIASRGEHLVLVRALLTADFAGRGRTEWEHLTVAEYDSQGRRVAMVVFDVDDLDAAYAELEARHAAAAGVMPTAGNRLRIPPNKAVHAGERVRELALAEDWQGLRDHCAPAYRFEDRRRLLRNEGDRDMLVANTRHLGRSVWAGATRTLLATNGDRLCLHRNRFVGDRAGADFLVESLEITEVDEAGRLLASVILDLEDRRTAAAEMLERYMRGEGAQRMPPSAIAFMRAMQAHDLAGMRAAIEPGFTFVDHRRTGLGVIGDADEYVASVAALHEQSADVTADVLYHVAVAEHGSLSVGRTFGTLRDGGPFESVYVRINRYEDGRNLGAELFEIDQMERATARFEELGRAYAGRRTDSACSRGGGG